MTPDDFIAKWRASSLKERSAAQEHFIDLCRLLGEPTPAGADPTGEDYCFERGASKTAGGEGWADVWKRGHFGWEYKGKRKDLQSAYAQLQQYAVALENPPLLVVSDMETIEVHTNWTNSVHHVHRIELDDLRSPEARDLLKAVFADPERLKPGKTRQGLTEEAAEEFAGVAVRLRARGHDPQAVAHFIDRLVFCMFAEDIGLLPKAMFTRMLEQAVRRPEQFQDMARQLFGAMQNGGLVGFEQVDWFDGGLFDSDEALPLDRADLEQVLRAARLDWSEIDPSIFGTLFERGLDPDKRGQLGAHYTDRDKIMLLVEPVVVRPLTREWQRVRGEIAAKLAAAEDASKAKSTRTRAYNAAEQLQGEFLERLRDFRVLDPACGSGNFLYLSLLALKDLEHRVNLDCEALGLHRQFPSVGPEAVRGIEINLYAAELGRVTVWIGEIQWMRRNGFEVSRRPILKPLNTIECRDALLTPDGAEADWPEADVIIGNPPFLGAKLMYRHLGRTYTQQLRQVYSGRLRGFSDYVCYWFEKAREAVINERPERAGLVATSSIRRGTNRPVLDRISRELEIYDAWEAQPWTIEGARVDVSLICFAPKDLDQRKHLNGAGVDHINPDLTTGLNLALAQPLQENKNTSFLGIQKSGPLDIAGDLAREFLLAPVNPNGRSNSDVLRPYWNGDDVTGRPRDVWLIDFCPGLSESDAALYEPESGGWGGLMTCQWSGFSTLRRGGC